MRKQTIRDKEQQHSNTPLKKKTLRKTNSAEPQTIKKANKGRQQTPPTHRHHSLIIWSDSVTRIDGHARNRPPPSCLGSGSPTHGLPTPALPPTSHRPPSITEDEVRAAGRGNRNTGGTGNGVKEAGTESGSS